MSDSILLIIGSCTVIKSINYLHVYVNLSWISVYWVAKSQNIDVLLCLLHCVAYTLISIIAFIITIFNCTNNVHSKDEYCYVPKVFKFFGNFFLFVDIMFMLNWFQRLCLWCLPFHLIAGPIKLEYTVLHYIHYF